MKSFEVTLSSLVPRNVGMCSIGPWNSTCMVGDWELLVTVGLMVELM